MIGIYILLSLILVAIVGGFIGAMWFIHWRCHAPMVSLLIHMFHDIRGEKKKVETKDYGEFVVTHITEKKKQLR